MRQATRPGKGDPNESCAHDSHKTTLRTAGSSQSGRICVERTQQLAPNGCQHVYAASSAQWLQDLSCQADQAQTHWQASSPGLCASAATASAWLVGLSATRSWLFPHGCWQNSKERALWVSLPWQILGQPRELKMCTRLLQLCWSSSL